MAGAIGVLPVLPQSQSTWGNLARAISLGRSCGGDEDSNQCSLHHATLLGMSSAYSRIWHATNCPLVYTLFQCFNSRVAPRSRAVLGVPRRTGASIRRPPVHDRPRHNSITCHGAECIYSRWCVDYPLLDSNTLTSHHSILPELAKHDMARLVYARASRDCTGYHHNTFRALGPHPSSRPLRLYPPFARPSWLHDERDTLSALLPPRLPRR